MMIDTPTPPRTTLMTWLQLMRLPTVFTALADILCGYCVSHPKADFTDLMAATPLGWLLLASAGLYLSGMVLNDVFDARLDAVERPERAIPSGRISKNAAAIFGIALMTIGLLAAWQADRMAGPDSRSLFVASMIVIAVIAYDTVLKKTIVSPLSMAACRFLNIILGAATAGIHGNGIMAMWMMPTVDVAMALAVYIVGVTWFARHETGEASRMALWSGLLIAAVALLMNIDTALSHGAGKSASLIAGLQLMLLASVMFRLGRNAIDDGSPRRLQQMVGKLLLGIIVLDAVMVYAITGNILLEAVILLLIVPAILLRKSIMMS